MPEILRTIISVVKCTQTLLFRGNSGGPETIAAARSTTSDLWNWARSALAGNLLVATGFFARIGMAFFLEIPSLRLFTHMHTPTDLIESLFSLIGQVFEQKERMRFKQLTTTLAFPEHENGVVADVTNARNYGRLLCPSIKDTRGVGGRNRLCKIKVERFSSRDQHHFNFKTVNFNGTLVDNENMDRFLVEINTHFYPENNLFRKQSVPNWQHWTFDHCQIGHSSRKLLSTRIGLHLRRIGQLKWSFVGGVHK